MKNKKGFTLIELLAVFVIMFMILGVAIYSFRNISKAKKEESKRKVIQTVETAAKDFFDINAYYYESLNSGDGSYIRVSIGKLVESDYLSVVTDPTTSKTLNKCDYVEVQKDANGNYTYTYVKNNGSDVCDTSNFIIVSDYKAPEVTLRITTTKKGNNDYYITDVNVLAHVKAGTSKIREVKYCTSNESCIPEQNMDVVSTNEADYNILNPSRKTDSSGIDGNNVVTTFTAKNRAGKSTTVYVTYKKDTENPVCGSNNGSTAWTKETRKIKQYCTDTTSGCTKNYYEYTYSGTKKTDKIDIVDNAGNKNTCDVNVYVDKTKPVCGSNNGSTTWTKNDRTITQQCVDNESGCDSVSKTYKSDKKTDTLTIKDKVGNTNTCDVNVYVDKTKPSCSLSLSGTKGNKVGNLQWYIKDNVNISGTYSDGFSGVQTKGLSTSKGSTNGKNKGTQSSETSSVTWYGYVVDKAGNDNDCSKTFGLEKSVSISFNASETNKQKSLNNSTKKKSNSSHGKAVFNSSYSTCGFGECSNIKCKTDSGKTKTCPKNYYAKSCMFVNSYSRVFNVTSKSIGNSVMVYADSGYDKNPSVGMNRIESHFRYSCDLSKNYYVRGCGKSSGGLTNATSHVYQYTSPAGNKSSEVTLYVDYGVDCDYASY